MRKKEKFVLRVKYNNGKFWYKSFAIDVDVFIEFSDALKDA